MLSMMSTNSSKTFKLSYFCKSAHVNTEVGKKNIFKHKTNNKKHQICKPDNRGELETL
jgi:hypothetical protein